MKLPISTLIFFFACSIAFATTIPAKEEQKKEPFVSEIASDTDYNAAQAPPAIAADFNEESGYNMAPILSSLLIIFLTLLCITLVQNDALERKYQNLVADFKKKKSQT